MSCVSGCPSTYARTYGQDAITRKPRRRASSSANRASCSPIPCPRCGGQHLRVDERDPPRLDDVVDDAGECVIVTRLVSLRVLGVNDRRVPSLPMVRRICLGPMVTPVLLSRLLDVIEVDIAAKTRQGVAAPRRRLSRRITDMARRVTGRCALVLLATMALAGCAFAPAATDPAAAHQRAQTVLAAWAAAVAAAGEHAAVTVVGELTGQIGDWEEAVGENNKRALMAGVVASVNPLPEERRQTARWRGRTGRRPRFPCRHRRRSSRSGQPLRRPAPTAPCSW